MATKFTLHQLRVFQQVANTQSITRAAELLFMTPPAVTKQIKNLADILSLPLFETVGKKLLLTLEGQQLRQYVDEYMEKTALLNHKILKLQIQSVEKIKLSITSSFQTLFFPLLKQFRQMYPLVEIELSSTTLEEQKKLFTDTSFDFFCSGDFSIEKQKYIADTFSRFKFILVAAGGHELTGKILNEKIIANYPFITGTADSESQHQQEKLFKQWQLKIAPIRVDSYGAVTEAVKVGLGIGLLPDMLAQPLLNSGELVKLSFDVKGRPYPLFLARHKEKPMTESMRIFREYFLDYWQEKHHKA